MEHCISCGIEVRNDHFLLNSSLKITFKLNMGEILISPQIISMASIVSKICQNFFHLVFS